MLDAIIHDLANNAIAIIFWISMGAYVLRRISKAK